MKRTFSFSMLLCAISLLLSRSVAAAINIATVTVGTPGNPTDPLTGNQYGSVSYVYDIGKNEVTVGQYTAFLNSVAASDPFSLYKSDMATDLNIAGIARNGSSGSYSYSVIGSPNKPITYVSWGDAARFANWLDNKQPIGPEGPGTTEDGAYTLNGAVTDAALNAVSRNANATWFLPSANEWYKAAYYDPVANHYWKYATRSNTTPVSAAPGNTPNTANYYGAVTGFAVTGSQDYDADQNYLTDVGSYTSSATAYGTFDQESNVFEWTETLVGGTSRTISGGSWLVDALAPPTSIHANLNALAPTLYGHTDGFRVASLPNYDSVPGDINRDGSIDAADISAMEQFLVAIPEYKLATGFNDFQLLALADVNGDGTITNADLQKLISNLLSGVGSSNSVPEPTSFGLLCLGALALSYWYWRRSGTLDASEPCIGFLFDAVSAAA